MTAFPSISEQAQEAELHYLGLRDTVRRVEAGKIKRAPHDLDRMRSRLDAAEAAAATLVRLAHEQPLMARV